MSEPSSAMTVLELTKLMSAQDDRWARILMYAQSTRNPAAPTGIAFFKKTWRAFMGNYYESVVGEYDSAAKVPARVVNWVLDAMADVIYPAARRIGLPDASFVMPDITIERGQPTTVAGTETAETDNVGGKIALVGVGIIFVGMATFAKRTHDLSKAYYGH